MKEKAVVFSSLTLIKNIIVFDTPGVPSTGTKELVEAKLEGSDEVAFGFATDIMYRQEKFGLGFMYRHSITVKANDGEATFKIDPTYTGLLNTVLKDQTVKAELGIPNYFVTGLYYMFTEKFGVEVHS